MEGNEMVSSRRCLHDIVYDVLTETKDGATYSNINKSALNHNRDPLEKVNHLIDAGLLEARPWSGNRFKYFTTPTGFEYLEAYEKVVTLTDYIYNTGSVHSHGEDVGFAKRE